MLVEEKLQEYRAMLRGRQRVPNLCLLCQLEAAPPQVLVLQDERARLKAAFLEWAERQSAAPLSSA